jgi:dienelactone hydrolase
MAIKMEILRNIEIAGSSNLPILLDLYTAKNNKRAPMVIFCHGFKGFKDWGGWDKVAQIFANAGMHFIKFNFSHNGTTPENPTSFTDLDAFGKNTFSKELEDLDAVINWYLSRDEFNFNGDLFIIGHSRGGGIAILKAAQDDRVKKVATWASVSDLGYAWNEELVERWKTNEIIYAENKRTGQLMPLYYSLYEDFISNKSRLDIETAVKKLSKPMIAIHGTEDESVSFEAALQIKKWNTAVKLDLIPQANHVFGMKHPPTEHTLPFDMQIVVEHTIAFFQAT